MKPDVTHDQLVIAAARWLRNTRGCGVVLTEIVAALPEIPDAIGWKHGDWSILVECKTSRADFRADGKKRFRSGDTAGMDPREAHYFTGVGQERYYLAPAGVLRAEDMPTGWGLLEWTGRGVRYMVRLAEHGGVKDPARSAVEVPLLVSALRRLQGGGVSAAVLAIRELGRGDTAIVRKVLERHERALRGLPEETPGCWCGECADPTAPACREPSGAGEAAE